MKITETTPKNAALDELGRRLAIFRKHRGLTQDQLAKESGVGVATIRRIEDGQDAHMGSWIKLLMAMEGSVQLEQLLPEEIRSPMQDFKKQNKKRTHKTVGWGDGQ